MFLFFQRGCCTTNQKSLSKLKSSEFFLVGGVKNVLLEKSHEVTIETQFRLAPIHLGPRLPLRVEAPSDGLSLEDS